LFSSSFVIEAGAFGYVGKCADAGELLRAVRQVAVHDDQVADVARNGEDVVARHVRLPVVGRPVDPARGGA